MKLYIYKSKSNTILYMAKTYRNSEGKSTSKIIERLGTLDEVKEKSNGEDPIVWAKKYIKEKTKEENENKGTYYDKLVEGKDLTYEQKVLIWDMFSYKKFFKSFNSINYVKKSKRNINLNMNYQIY